MSWPLAGAYAFAAVRFRALAGWHRHALYTAAHPSAVFFLFAVTGVLANGPGDPLFPVAGVLNRLLLALAFGWVTVTGLRLLFRPPGDRRSPPGPPRPPARG